MSKKIHAMTLLTYSIINELLDTTRLAQASYEGEAAPEGWRFVSMSAIEQRYELRIGLSIELGLGRFFTTPAGAAAAILFDGQGHIAISLRGTDKLLTDAGDWLSLFGGDYWREFLPLIQAVSVAYPTRQSLVVGHSLGGMAVHQMAEQWLARDSGLAMLNDPAFYSLASPQRSPESVVQRLGFENDIVFNLSTGGDQKDLMLWANISPDASRDPHLNAHSPDAIESALKRAYASDIFWWAGDDWDWRGNMVFNFRSQFRDTTFYPQSGSLGVFGMDEPVTLSTGGRQRFLKIDDVIFGRNNKDPNAVDFIDGMAGNDTIHGRGGYNVLFGGDGSDLITVSHNLRAGSFSGPASYIYGGAGNDTIKGANILAFGGNGDDLITVSYSSSKSTIELMVDQAMTPWTPLWQGRQIGHFFCSVAPATIRSFCPATFETQCFGRQTTQMTLLSHRLMELMLTSFLCSSQTMTSTSTILITMSTDLLELSVQLMWV